MRGVVPTVVPRLAPRAASPYDITPCAAGLGRRARWGWVWPDGRACGQRLGTWEQAASVPGRRRGTRGRGSLLSRGLGSPLPRRMAYRLDVLLPHNRKRAASPGMLVLS